jgi:hypothetical protein
MSALFYISPILVITYTIQLIWVKCRISADLCWGVSGGRLRQQLLHSSPAVRATASAVFAFSHAHASSGIKLPLHACHGFLGFTVFRTKNPKPKKPGAHPVASYTCVHVMGILGAQMHQVVGFVALGYIVRIAAQRGF